MNLHYRTASGEDKKFSGEDEKKFKKSRPANKGAVVAKSSVRSAGPSRLKPLFSKGKK